MPTQADDLEGSSQASVCKQARVLDRQANYVIVERLLDGPPEGLPQQPRFCR